MKINHFNYLLTFLVGYIFRLLIPQYQAAAEVPVSSSYEFDTLANKIEVANYATIITPPYYSEEEKTLDMWSFWYNESGNMLNNMLTEARKLKGASVRPMLAKDSTEGNPWMRVVYDDCSSGTCIVRNFGHLQPEFRNHKWYIKSVTYPDAYKNILQNKVWTLKPRSDLPYNVAQFVTEFYPLALEHERRYGIPWQIKLAQAGMESRWGESKLARSANQYFGIKAPSTWKGKMRAAKDEGGKYFNFAAHSSAAESFEYHSQFLKTYARYAGVFKYKPDSTYQYVFHSYARKYGNPKLFKPVFHRINGKRVRLVDGKTYTLSGLECAMIELSRAGYGTDPLYSEAILNAANSFSQQTN